MVDADLGSKTTLSEEDFKLQVEALMLRKEQLLAWIVSDCAITRGAKLRHAAVKNLENTGVLSNSFHLCPETAIEE